MLTYNLPTDEIYLFKEISANILAVHRDCASAEYTKFKHDKDVKLGLSFNQNPLYAKL